MSKSVSFERPLADGDRLEVTIKGEGKTTFQPPSGWTLTADDIVETRCLSQSQSMRFPCDADTTRRLKWIIKGNQQVPWLRRIIRRVKERFNAVGT